MGYLYFVSAYHESPNLTGKDLIKKKSSKVEWELKKTDRVAL
jgi:hypothetical protein